MYFDPLGEGAFEASSRGTFRDDLFFAVGPLRTGSSLLSRCLDDHPGVVCLCESEINRALFRDYAVAHHFGRMVAHGLSIEDAVAHLDRRKQDDFASLEAWYTEIRPRLAHLYDKPGSARLGDKSPDFYRSPELVRHLAEHHPLIYTVRDPRAIFASIDAQIDATPGEKAERWSFLLDNFRAWEPHLDRPNVLVVRYEDLVRIPMLTMSKVYSHLGLANSTRFLEPFARIYPYRFLWSTAVDWETGIRKDFDPRRIDAWQAQLGDRSASLIQSDPDIARFMARFGYESRAPKMRPGSITA